MHNSQVCGIVTAALSVSVILTAIWLYRSEKSRQLSFVAGHKNNNAKTLARTSTRNIHDPLPFSNRPSSPILASQDDLPSRHSRRNLVSDSAVAPAVLEPVEFTPTNLYVLRTDPGNICSLGLQTFDSADTYYEQLTSNEIALRILRHSLPSSAPTVVNARAADPGNLLWSADALNVLIEGLRRVWEVDPTGTSFNSLSVCLPITLEVGASMATNANSNVPFPPRMETLFWRGHKEQLPFFFHGKLSHLTNLTLHCEISLADFGFILWAGSDSLQRIEIRTINQVQGTLAAIPGTVRIMMQNLASLTIASELNPGPVFVHCSFPRVTKIDFAISASDFDIMRCLEGFTVQDINEVDLHCIMRPRDKEKIRTDLFPHIRDVNIRADLLANTSLPDA